MPDGRALVVEFTLLGAPYRAMNGGPGHPHTDAVSFQIDVDTQDELDRLWDALLADGGSPMACGWLTDRWGVAWQVTPSMLGELMTRIGRPGGQRPRVRGHDADGQVRHPRTAGCRGRSLTPLHADPPVV